MFVRKPYPRIGIVDIGCGNLKSIEAACLHAGVSASILQCPDQCANMDGLVLPGVGSFGFFMERLRQTNFESAIKERVRSGGTLLGICLGLQVLFNSSDESKGVSGLSLLSGNVKKLPVIDTEFKVPRVGWSKISPSEYGSFFRTNFDVDNQYFYFVHSYYAEPQDKEVCTSFVEANGLNVCASIETRQIVATQFHPEKSGPEALKIFNYFERKIRENS